jgi:hypothetical protein
MAGPALRSSLKFGNTERTTSVEKISPRPTPMKTSSIEARASRGSAALSFASANFLPARSNARSTIWRPRPPNWAFAASRVARRIAARARPVTTTLSQAAGGDPPSAREISTSSPLCNSEISGAIRPLIFAPTAELPTSVWTA